MNPRRNKDISISRRELAPAPILKCKNPRYPTKLEVQGDRDLLRKNLPLPWRTMEFLAIASPLLLFHGCHAPSGADAKSPSSSPATLVAPIFEHGDGYGFFSCMAVSGPVFLSESVALSIIKTTMEKYGVSEFAEKKEYPSLIIKERRVPSDYEIPRPKELEISKMDFNEIHQRPRDRTLISSPFTVDLFDSKHSIGIEYVSAGDARKVVSTDYGVSAEDFQTRNAASLLSDEAQKLSEKQVIGIFYDPVTNPQTTPYPRYDQNQTVEQQRQKEFEWGKQLPAANKEAEEEARRLLEKQVVDFAEWLKAQGVI